MRDTPKHQGQRNQLVDLLREKGIKNETVLNVLAQVPRHLFMDAGLADFAYEDNAYPIAASQTISQPYTVAFQTELLELSPTDKVLEIGTGSGYQTAVLLGITPFVYTIERQQTLFKQTQLLFQKLGIRPKRHFFGDGYLGYKEAAPYDKIIVTAAAPKVPEPLLKQLKIGGKLVLPVGDREQIMTRLTRTSEMKFDREQFGHFRFVPMLEDKTK